MSTFTKADDSELRANVSRLTREVRALLVELEAIVANAQSFKRVDWVSDLHGAMNSVDNAVARCAQMAVQKTRAS